MGNIPSHFEVQQRAVQDNRMGHGTSIELVVDAPDMGLNGKWAHTQASRSFFATASSNVGSDDIDLTGAQFHGAFQILWCQVQVLDKEATRCGMEPYFTPIQGDDRLQHLLR